MAEKAESPPTSRIELAIALLCIFLGIVMTRVATEESFWSGSSDSESWADPLGTLTPKDGTVRFRSKTSIAWHDLPQQSYLVRAGDIIFTGEDGHASIDIKPGISAQMQPDSLIIIQRTGIPSGAWGAVRKGLGFGPSNAQAPTLEIGLGGITLQVSNANSPTKVRVLNKDYVVSSSQSNAPVKIVAHPENASAPVEFSAAKESNVTVKDLSPNALPVLIKTVALEAPVAPAPQAVIVPAAAPALSLPKDGQRISGYEESTTIQFEWEPLPNARGYTIEISASKSFERQRRLELRTVKKTQWTWKNPHNGVLYWHVKVTNTKYKSKVPAPFSEPRQINVDLRPSLSAPKMHEQVIEY